MDESKKRDYLLAAVAVSPGDIALARKVVRSLLKPGQRRLHIVKESPRRQHEILSALGGIDAQIMIYQAGIGFRTNIERRRACIELLVEHAAAGHSSRLVLESDEGELERDRRLLFHEVERRGCRDVLTYSHATAVVEPLLAIPDAIAWAWARGGDAQRRAEHLVTDVVRL